jgi:hypothetical protein
MREMGIAPRAKVIEQSRDNVLGQILAPIVQELGVGSGRSKKLE